MSFQTLVLQRLEDITNRLNEITNNSKTTDEFLEQSPLDFLSKLRVSLNGASQFIYLQAILDYFQSLGYITLADIYQASVILTSTYEWTGTGYSYNVIYVKWVKDGEFHEFTFNQVITLDDSDATYNRQDALVLNLDSETIYKKTGTPAPVPGLPVLNENERLITPILVTAGTTAPVGVSNEDIYIENTEWTSSVTGSIDPNSTNNPETGTKSIYFNSAVSGNNVVLDRGSELSTNGATSLLLSIKNGVAGNFKFRIETEDGSTVLGSTLVQHNTYGYDKNNTSDHQHIVIPVSNLGITDAGNIQKLTIKAEANGVIAYIDNVKLQFGTETSTTTDEFLPRGGYEGTAQDLKDLIDLIGSTPGIITLTGDGVDNTDPDNPVMDLSNWQQTSEKGVADGYASLDSGGKVPTVQLPSYVDDVLEYADVASFPVTGETGKIYIAQDTNFSYRWTGSVYVKISDISGSEIKTLLFAESDTNNLTDILLAKLNSIRSREVSAPIDASGAFNFDMTYVRRDFNLTANATMSMSNIVKDAEANGGYVDLNGYTLDFNGYVTLDPNSEDYSSATKIRFTFDVLDAGGGTEDIRMTITVVE